MTDRVYKLEIFLPQSCFDAVRQALWSVDAGHIGAYDRCLSRSRVESCWRPLEGTDPFLGMPGELCRAEELEGGGLLPGGPAGGDPGRSEGGPPL
ncbi:MAG: hypothetical protein ACLUJG_01510 [Lawsonibacter sp.]